METHTYPHFPCEVSTVHIALYSNVSNAAELRKRLLTVATLAERDREPVNYAFIDAKMVTSPLHVLTAVYQAILAYVQGSLRTKNVHSEVLWALSPSHNISDVFNRLGVSDTTQSLIVVRVCPPSFTANDFKVNVGLVVNGDLGSLASLKELTDWALVRKYYKLQAEEALQRLGRRGSQDIERQMMDELVVSSIAMKSVSS